MKERKSYTQELIDRKNSASPSPPAGPLLEAIQANTNVLLEIKQLLLIATASMLDEGEYPDVSEYLDGTPL